MSPTSIKIYYCTRCKFLLRSTWIAQELLSSFDNKLSEVALIPSSGGIFEIHLNDQVVYSNKTGDQLPDIKDLKLLVRDKVDPDRKIGHD